MIAKDKKLIKKIQIRICDTRVGRLFLNRKFVYYTWTGIFISLLNIFLLWLLIDNFGIPTIISSTLVVIGTFVLRYVLFDFFKIL